jgi:UDP-N-acetylmuramate--alanine ligase
VRVSQERQKGRHYFFVGIGGSGMSGLAQILAAQGNRVSGSDRTHDLGRDLETFACLQAQGIAIFPQDGSGVNAHVDEVVISGAIEPDNPDVRKAQASSVVITARADLLARDFNESRGIAVGGTSGKSTITAMAAKMMDLGSLDPTVINGAVIPEYRHPQSIGNAKLGNSAFMLVETDESDGSVAKFFPEVGIVSNISKDHKPVAELLEIFSHFAHNVGKRIIINGDCPLSRTLVPDLDPRLVVTFGTGAGNQVRGGKVVISAPGAHFQVEGSDFFLPLRGMHNVANALAVIALGRVLEISYTTVSAALAQFSGVERRLELVGEETGVKVYDDYSHNPAKIAAALEALKPEAARLVVVYQPHGYGPTRFLRKELVEVFNQHLGPRDVLYMLDIYYAGGTAEKSISSAELVQDIRVPRTEHVRDRNALPGMIEAGSQSGDVVIIMGARDNTLSTLARDVVARLRIEKRCKTRDGREKNTAL